MPITKETIHYAGAALAIGGTLYALGNPENRSAGIKAAAIGLMLMEVDRVPSANEFCATSIANVFKQSILDSKITYSSKQGFELSTSNTLSRLYLCLKLNKNGVTPSASMLLASMLYPNSQVARLFGLANNTDESLHR